MDKQELRNALAKIEDDARAWRNEAAASGQFKAEKIANLVSRLAQLIREEIVK